MATKEKSSKNSKSPKNSKSKTSKENPNKKVKKSKKGGTKSKNPNKIDKADKTGEKGRKGGKNKPDKPDNANKIDKAVKSTKQSAKLKPIPDVIIFDWDNVLSTGSTLLDLAISGGRVRGGGIPAGILVEVYGKSSSGKTAILSEVCGCAQARGGEVMFQDPEARLDAAYSRIYGMEINKDNYHKPNTVSELFDNMVSWNPDQSHINVMGADSLAALSTELELESGDKMGMRRAKEFSTELRKYARLIQKLNWLIICSNQVRQGTYGDVTPGGNAVEFYSSLRMAVNRIRKLEVSKKVGKKQIKRAIGIESKAVITKSSIDIPYREAPLFIVFNYGIDDVRANLQWYKDMTADNVYRVGEVSYKTMEGAIKYVEETNNEITLKEMVIDLWLEIEEKFKNQRKKKIRA